MQEKSPKSREEIERLVLDELRQCDACEGAFGVSVTGKFLVDTEFAEEPNWTIAAFNSGTASDYECERALLKIVSVLQGFYVLVQKH